MSLWKTCAWLPFGIVGKAWTREDAGSVSGLVCARSYFNHLCLGWGSNKVDLRNGTIRERRGGLLAASVAYAQCWDPSPGNERELQTKLFPVACVSPSLLGCSLCPSPLMLPPMDTDEELIPSSPQQPFTCLIAFITSQVIPRAAAALPALPLSFPLCSPARLSSPGTEELKKKN